jgi:hypothetical protein
MTDISGIVLTSADYTVFGNKRIHTFSWRQPGTDTWPSGGVQCPPSNFKLTKVDFVDCDGGSLAYSYDYANEKLYAVTGGSGLALVDAVGVTPTSGLFLRIRAQGTGLSS